jgi:hypothetical protein
MHHSLLATLALLATSAHPSDELKRERLPANVDFVVHFDVEGFKATQLWKHVSEKGEDLDLDIDELDEIEEELGIDPLTDVRAVTLYKMESQEDPTVVLFSSTSKVDAALAKHQLERDYRKITSRGIELHTWGDADDPDDDERMFAYVHPVGEERVVVVAGDEESAVHAARVLRGEDPSHASAGTLLTLAPARGSFLYVAAAEIPHLHDLTPASQVFGLAQGIQVDLGEAGGFLRAHMGVTTGSAEDALNISNVLNGLVSLARLAGNELGELLELLTGIRLATRGSEVLFDFEFGVDRLIEILEELHDEEEQAIQADPDEPDTGSADKRRHHDRVKHKPKK